VERRKRQPIVLEEMTNRELVAYVAELVPMTGQRMQAVNAVLDEVLRRFGATRAVR
jgi:hypothetical protein